MPKSTAVDTSVRQAGMLVLEDIPLNQYQSKLSDVKNKFSKTDLVHMYEDMCLIREFEVMLEGIRTVKTYNGVDYSYTGPAHCSHGQEALAVGQAYVLDENDFSFGTHRSHGEVLSRAMIAIRRFDEQKLYDIMHDFKDGALLRNVEKFSKNCGDVRALAKDFFLYGFMTELFGREIGFTGGLGNSMHVFFTPFGIYPNNAIVGASGGIGTGVALFKKLSKQPGICVVNSGDGSLSTGHAWEAMGFATMNQYKTLWEDAYNGGLPILFNFVNNFYAMSGQTDKETTGYDVLARVGAAFNKEQMHTERIDGYNIFAVIDAFKRKKQILLNKKGPVLLDTITYRHTGHSVTDQMAYRSREEMDMWRKIDSLAGMRNDLIDAKMITQAAAEENEKNTKDFITQILKKAVDTEFSPRMNFFKEPDAIAKCMFSNEHTLKQSEDKPDVIGKKEDNPRLKKISRKHRKAVDETGKPVSALKMYTYRDAIFEALLDKFYEDSSMVLFGEDVREHGNSFGVLQGMYESVPYHRLFNTPIAEGAIVNAAVGYAMAGGRAVPEIMWCDFLGRCGDELFNQLAKWQGMSAGCLKMPCTVRVSVGAFYGAQHSQDWTSLCTHVPGLKIVYPATPYDAKGLLNTALASSDPVMFFESQKLYDMGEHFAPAGVPAEYYEVSLGKADVKRQGSDLTIVTIGPTLYVALEAAEILSERFGMETEVIDARTLVPFDYDTVIESVKKTNKVLFISDACERGSYIHTLASNITEFAFDYLDAPPVCLGAHNWVSPCPELEKFFYPQKELVLDYINEKIVHLDGHTPTYNVTNQEKLRCESLGI